MTSTWRSTENVFLPVNLSFESQLFFVDLCNVEQATSNVSNQDVANFALAMLNVSVTTE